MQTDVYRNINGNRDVKFLECDKWSLHWYKNLTLVQEDLDVFDLKLWVLLAVLELEVWTSGYHSLVYPQNSRVKTTLCTKISKISWCQDITVQKFCGCQAPVLTQALLYSLQLLKFIYLIWEGNKILRNLHCRFDWHYTGQICGGDFTKFCGLLRIHELYLE